MKQNVQRKAFTKAEIKLVQTIADEIAKEKRPSGVPHFDHLSRMLREKTKRYGLKGHISSGCFRIAFVGKTFVLKMQYSGETRALADEVNYIQKMRAGTAARHFPLTQLIKSKNRRVKIIIQETVNMSHRGMRKFYSHVEDLGDYLGVDDVHSGNYGWAGPKGKEWPVFVDVDCRSTRRYKTKTKRRSWMV